MKGGGSVLAMLKGQGTFFFAGTLVVVVIITPARGPPCLP